MTKKEKDFVATVWQYYAAHGRAHLPWRKNHQPYRVLVSELMLQQTQVDRVVPKFQAFVREFPTVAALAAAPLSRVLVAWQGLGYNRRAKYLHEAAKAVVRQHRGVFPKHYEALLALPGVGPYTASAIMVFAHNAPRVLIETNVRTVYLHHFFKEVSVVDDTEILALVERTLPKERAREWYAALMDYGSYLKRTYGNPNHKSRGYKKQSTFMGSDRQLRGAILRILVAASKGVTEKQLLAEFVSEEKERVVAQLTQLVKEGLVIKKKGQVTLPT